MDITTLLSTFLSVRNVCLAHKSYIAHGCDGQNSKDITSIACPVCSKTVKFNRSQQVDQVWEEHYLKECTQKAPTASQKAVKTCAKSGCPTILGPSNYYKCPKCSLVVCLVHRTLDGHSCLSLLRGSNKQSANNGSLIRQHEQQQKSRIPNSIASNGIKKSSNNSQTQYSGDNSLKGSAERRANSSVVTGNTQISNHICPFCDQIMSSNEILQQHIYTVHPDNSHNTNESFGSSASNYIRSAAGAAQSAAMSAANAMRPSPSSDMNGNLREVSVSHRSN